MNQNLTAVQSTEQTIQVLLIDDNSRDERLIRSMLADTPRGSSEKEIQLTHVERLEAALALVSERKFDVILLAPSSPESTGLADLEKIRKQASRIPVILISSLADNRTPMEALRAGAQDYLEKEQLDTGTLVRRIRYAIVRQKAQQAVLNNKEHLESMLGTAAEAIISVDAAQKIIFFNKAAEQIFGYHADEVIEQPIDLLLPRRFVESHRHHIEDFAKESTRDRRMAHRRQIFGRRKDGTEFPVAAGISKFDITGQMVFTVIVEDMTERQQTEATRSLLAAIVETSDDAILSKNLDGIVQSWNRGAEQLYGYSASEVVGKHVSLHVPHERAAEVSSILEQIKRGERIDHYETVRLKKSGERVDVSLTISPLFDGEGKIVGASSIAHDITQRKDFENRLQLQLRHMMALREIDRAITASLDIRVTLNVLLDQVTTQLNVDAAAVLLFDLHSHILEYSVVRGFHNENFSRNPLRLGEGLAGRAALERRLISIPDLSHLTDPFGKLHMFAQQGYKTYFGLPLIAKGQCQGVLEVLNREPLTPNADWLDFMHMLAGQAAIAIDSASLFNELQKSNSDLVLAYDTTLEGWSHALDLRDKETEGHTQRVTETTMQLVRAMGINDQELLHIRRGALLHDIGKMGIPDSILLKTTGLTDEEWQIMRQHPVYAYEMIAPIDYLKSSVDIPYCHHEKWDGSGYPRGLRAEQIPLAARAFAVVDVWDALRSDRPYRASWTTDQVLQHIKSEAGKHFDPDVVAIFEGMKLNGMS